MKRLLAPLGILCFSSVVFADQYHYNNIIIGDRALGLGGAYTAMADDSSGVFYNPAGLAFALSNDISGSANAFYWRKAVYKKALGNVDFEERSQGSVPSFFGGLQKLDHIAKGLVFAFGVYSTDNELKDQNDLYADMTINSVQIMRFHRAVQLRAATNYFGGGLGYRVTPNLAIGIGLKYMMIDELTQEYQDVEQATRRCPDPAVACESTEAISTVSMLSQNVRQNLSAAAIQPILGLQYAFGRFSFGLTLKKGILLSDEFERSTEVRTAYSDIANGTYNRNLPNYYRTTLLPTDPKQKPTEGALGDLPTNARFGIAWYAMPRFLWSTDIMYYTEAKSEKVPTYDRGSVLNVATGMEFYATPTLPIRFGFFQNNDARPKLDPNKTGQADHIDYNGISLFLGWVQPNSQISFGTIYQVGSGESQKRAGDKDIQTVEATSMTLAFSATHNF